MKIEQRATLIIEELKQNNTSKNIDIANFIDTQIDELSDIDIFKDISDSIHHYILGGSSSIAKDPPLITADMDSNLKQQLIAQYQDSLRYLIVQSTIRSIEDEINYNKKIIEDIHKNLNMDEYHEINQSLLSLEKNNLSMKQQSEQLEEYMDSLHDKQQESTITENQQVTRGQITSIHMKTIATIFEPALQKKDKNLVQTNQKSTTRRKLFLTSSASRSDSSQAPRTTDPYKSNEAFINLPKALQKALLYKCFSQEGIKKKDEILLENITAFFKLNKEPATKSFDAWSKSSFIRKLMINHPNMISKINSNINNIQLDNKWLKDPRVFQDEFKGWFQTLNDDAKTKYFSLYNEQQHKDILTLNLNNGLNTQFIKEIYIIREKRRTKIKELENGETSLNTINLNIIIGHILEEAQITDEAQRSIIRELLSDKKLEFKKFVIRAVKNPHSIKMIYNDEEFLKILKNLTNKDNLKRSIDSYLKSINSEEINPDNIKKIHIINARYSAEGGKHSVESLEKRKNLYEQLKTIDLQGNAWALLTKIYNQTKLESQPKNQDELKEDIIQLFKALNIDKPTTTKIADLEKFTISDITEKEDFIEILQSHYDNPNSMKLLKRNLQNYFKNKIDINTMDPLRIKKIELINQLLPTNHNVLFKYNLFKRLKETDLRILEQRQTIKTIYQNDLNLIDRYLNLNNAHHDQLSEDDIKVLDSIINLTPQQLNRIFNDESKVTKAITSLNTIKKERRELKSKQKLDYEAYLNWYKKLNVIFDDHKKAYDNLRNIIDDLTTKHEQDVEIISTEAPQELLNSLRNKTIEGAAIKLFDKDKNFESKAASFITSLQGKDETKKKLLDFINQNRENLSIIKKLLNKIFFFRKTNLSITQDLLKRIHETNLNADLISDTIEQAELFKSLKVKVDDKNHQKIKFIQEILKGEQDLQKQHNIAKQLFNALDKFPEIYHHQDIMRDLIKANLSAPNESQQKQIITSTLLKQVRDDIIKKTTDALFDEKGQEASKKQLKQYLTSNPKALLLLDTLKSNLEDNEKDTLHDNLKKILKLSCQHHKDTKILKEQVFSLIFSQKFLNKLTKESVITLSKLSIEEDHKIKKLIAGCLEQGLVNEEIKLIDNILPKDLIVSLDEDTRRDLVTNLYNSKANINEDNIYTSLIKFGGQDIANKVLEILDQKVIQDKLQGIIINHIRCHPSPSRLKIIASICDFDHLTQEKLEIMQNLSTKLYNLQLQEDKDYDIVAKNIAVIKAILVKDRIVDHKNINKATALLMINNFPLTNNTTAENIRNFMNEKRELTKMLLSAANSPSIPSSKATHTSAEQTGESLQQQRE